MSLLLYFSSIDTVWFFIADRISEYKIYTTVVVSKS